MQDVKVCKAIMLKHEFEELTGKKFNDEQFAVIENVILPSVSEACINYVCALVRDDTSTGIKEIAKLHKEYAERLDMFVEKVREMTCQ